MFVILRSVIPLRGETDCHSRLHISPAGSVGASALQRCPPDTRTFAMTGEVERIAARLTAVSPAGSVGASASQRCPPDTRTAMTGEQIIVSLPYFRQRKKYHRTHFIIVR